MWAGWITGTCVSVSAARRGEVNQKSTWDQSHSFSASFTIQSLNTTAYQVSSEALGYFHEKEWAGVHSHGHYSKRDKHQGLTPVYKLLQTRKGPWNNCLKENRRKEIHLIWIQAKLLWILCLRNKMKVFPLNLMKRNNKLPVICIN